MRGEKNADLFGPLQAEYEKGRTSGSDVWLHKNRFACVLDLRTRLSSHSISGLWGSGSQLDTYLRENGYTTLFFAGVNADQVFSVAISSAI